MRRKLLFYSIFSVVLTQVIVIGAIAASSAPQAIPIGALVSLSGKFSNIGTQAKAGYEIAAEEINKAGGIFVKEYNKKIPVDLIVENTESVPEKAISRMEYLYTSKNVVGYLGEGNMVNGQGVAEKNKIPALTIAATHIAPHNRGLKYWFSTFSKAPDNAKVIFDILDSVPAEKRPKTVALFVENTESSIDHAESSKKEAAQRGYKVVVEEKYSPMTKDLSPLIMAAKNAGAEVVLSSPVAPDGMLMMRQIKELDYNPKAIIVLRGAEDLSWAKALGPMGDYVLLTGSWHYKMKYPGVDKLNAAHQAKYGRPSDLLVGTAYASMQVLAAAIEKAGTLDTTKIRDALAVTDNMMTVAGRVKFRPDGTNTEPCNASVQWLGGTQKLVWPNEFKETSFVYPIPPWKER